MTEQAGEAARRYKETVDNAYSLGGVLDHPIIRFAEKVERMVSGTGILNLARAKRELEYSKNQRMENAMRISKDDSASDVAKGLFDSKVSSELDHGIFTGKATEAITGTRQNDRTNTVENLSTEERTLSGTIAVVEGIAIGVGVAEARIGGAKTNVGKILDTKVSRPAETSTPAPEVSNEAPTTTVYRGVSESHPGYNNALEGTAIPRGGDADASLHQAGDTRSPYTSWTTDKTVAEKFATNEGAESGVVLEQNVPNNGLIKTPNIFEESEVLLEGKQTVEKVFKVEKPKIPEPEIEKK